MAIERLILLHLNLIELCSTDNKKYLDEDATEVELLEPILYFYSAQSTNSYSQPRPNHNQQTIINNSIGLNNTNTISNTGSLDISYDVKEAIQFSGLCTALFTLPNVLCPTDDQTTLNSNGHLETSVVHLTNCTLVYQPLESQYASAGITKRPLIIAVVQISNRINNHEQQQHPTNFYSFTSSAVAAALQRCHELFCLVRGGGIHNRLITFDPEEEMQKTIDLSEADEGAFNSPTYGTSMHRLFELRRKRRKLQRNIEKKQYMIQYNSSYLLNDNLQQTRESSRCKSFENDSESSVDEDDNVDEEDDDDTMTITSMSETLCEIENDLIRLEMKVPIRSVRADLRVHYDTFLSEYRWYRNCIELVPPPIPILTESYGIISCKSSCCCRYPFQHIDTDDMLQLNVALRELLLSSSTTLFAIATYDNGRRLFKCADEVNFPISCATCNQLMQYMSDISCRTQCQVASTDKKIPFDRSGSTNRGASRRINGFLSTPPLSLLSSLDSLEDSTFSVADPNPKYGNISTVWAPRVWIPLLTSAAPSPENIPLSQQDIVRIQQYRICFYTYGRFTFLIFLEDGKEATSEKENRFQYVLQQIEEFMSTKMYDLFPNILTDTSISMNNSDSRTELVQSGQTIIAVDRRMDTAFFVNNNLGSCGNYPGEYHGSHSNTLVDRPGDRLRRLLFNAPHRSKKEIHFDNKKQSKLPIIHARVGEMQNLHSSEGSRLDCRYRIAASLSTETLLALDDIIDELYRHVRQPNDTAKLSSNRNDDAELCNERKYCTSTSYIREMYVETSDMWIYANTDGEKELYILLDLHRFASLEEVCSHVKHIQNDLRY
jgi:hypothetical protein